MSTEVILAPIERQAIINGIVEQLLEKLGNQPFLTAIPVSPPAEKVDEILDIPATAEFLKVKVRWIRLQVTLNQIPYHKVGRYVRFKKSELERYLHQNRCLLLRLGAC